MKENETKNFVNNTYEIVEHQTAVSVVICGKGKTRQLSISFRKRCIYKYAESDERRRNGNKQSTRR